MIVSATMLLVSYPTFADSNELTSEAEARAAIKTYLSYELVLRHFL